MFGRGRLLVQLNHPCRLNCASIRTFVGTASRVQPRSPLVRDYRNPAFPLGPNGRIYASSSLLTTPGKSHHGAPGQYGVSFHTGMANYAPIPNMYPDVSIPEVTVTEHAFSNVDRFANDVALVNGITGEEFTYKELKAAVDRVASGLARHGLRQGDTILLFAFNSPEYIIAFHAAATLGATVSLANPASLASELTRQVLDSGATYLYADEDSMEKIQQTCDEVKKIKKVFVQGKADGAISFSELLADDGSARPKHVKVDVHTGIVTLPYSSGTTGVPKGVMVNHYGSVANVQQTQIESVWIKREGAVILAVLPFFHIFGYMVSMCLALFLGQKQIVIPRFEPKHFLGAIEKYKCDLVYVVPPMLLFMARDPVVDKYDLSSLTRVLCAAAPVKTELAREFNAKYPGVIMGQAYGLTETGPGLCCTPLKWCVEHPEAAGALYPNTEGKIIDLDTGEELGPNEQGELLARGPQNMVGYLGRPDATAETIDGDGWLHTGDIGYYDEKGLIYIVDRRKELIKYKSMQVAPAELEGILLQHPAVADAGVTSIPDDVAGELPIGYVTLKKGKQATEQEISEFVAERVAYYKKLRGGVVIIDAIPKSPTGKILRRLLKDIATGT